MNPLVDTHILNDLYEFMNILPANDFVIVIPR